MVTLWIGIVLGLLGFIGFFVPAMAGSAFWLLFIGFVALLLGILLEDL